MCVQGVRSCEAHDPFNEAGLYSLAVWTACECGRVFASSLQAALAVAPG
jgi:hypothetical protein